MDELTPTAKILFEKYGRLTLTLYEVGQELGMTKEQTIRNRYSAGRFPIPTSKEGIKRVADVRDVAAYIDKRREGSAAV